ncbi:TonB-dependent siderophore receptor [Sphingomonas solaris]|uniref:TonB-dependent siderophore receptor n=1 Tax=Alterirhizorhabdus solaris TaxID=2529389 RepID=A0A558R8N9_9SPHN|nr:TonB-dependent siderophore receptor [Sphingomonas solaris]TVV75760.1 TonB-dependent siderophore receptor [Sphingomonas solaris]
MSAVLSCRLSTLLLAGVAVQLPAVAAAQAGPAIFAAEPASPDATRREDGTIIVTAGRFVPSGAITASKTTVPLIETPQSVSVVSRDQIDLLNFIDVQQAVRYTAGIVGENYGPDLRFDFLTLRGFIPVQYIDGLQAPISSTISNVGVDLYGFEAVDILKGPSSVLYGTTPPGGIYNLTSRRPSAQAGGEIQLKYGTDDFKQAAGTVTGELTDGLTARLTGLYRDRDSQTDFVTARRAYVAPAVTYEIGPDTKITGLGFYQWDRVEGDTNGFLPALGVLTANPVGKVRRGINLGEPDYNFYRRRQWSAGYEFTHRFSDALRFTQNARWGEYHEYQQIIYGAGLDADNRTVSRFNFPFRDDVEQFTIDSRFDAEVATGPIEHRILAGFDYRNYREASAFAFGAATSIDLFDPVYSATPIAVPGFFPFTDQRLKQEGVYLQDQAKLGGFILTLSGRQDWVQQDNYAAGAAIPRRKQDRFSWRVGGTYVTESGIAPYVSYATSFQPVVGQALGGEAFRPTVGKQVEGGIKFDARGLGEGVKLFATAAVFRIEQSNVLTTDPRNVLFQVQTGEVVSKGVELEVVGRFNEQLSVNAAYSYDDAKITRSNVAVEVGARLPAQPRHKASLFVDYTVASGALAGFGAGGGVRYLSDSPGRLPVGPSAFGAADPRTFVSPGVTLFDATLHYDLPGWRFAVNGSNIFDKRYAGRCSGPSSCFFGQSRQVIGTVTKRF